MQKFVTDAENRFEFLHADIVEPLPPSREMKNNVPYKYLLTLVDRASNWCEIVPSTDITAKTVASEIYKNWIVRFGVPLYLLTDKGRQFESELMSELSEILGICRLRTSSYH